MVIGFGIAPEGATIDYTDHYAQADGRHVQGASRRWIASSRSSASTASPTAIGFVGLQDWDERDAVRRRTSPAQLFPQFMGITGLMAFPITPPPLGQDGFGQPVSFVVQTTGTWEELDTLVQKLLAKMAREPEADQSRLRPQAQQAAAADRRQPRQGRRGRQPTSTTVGRTLETMLGGRHVTRFKKGSEQYDVIVQIDDDARAHAGATCPTSSCAAATADGAAVEPGRRAARRSRPRSSTTSTSCARRRSAPASRPAIRMGEALDWMEDALQRSRAGRAVRPGGQSREFRESARATFADAARWRWSSSSWCWRRSSRAGSIRS